MNRIAQAWRTKLQFPATCPICGKPVGKSFPLGSEQVYDVGWDCRLVTIDGPFIPLFYSPRQYKLERVARDAKRCTKEYKYL